MAAESAPERVALIDYGAGNLRSAARALEAVGAQVTVTASAAEILAADRIVLPGVGAFGQCIEALRSVDGLEAALHEAVIERRRPFLGICVGMQLLASEGHEHGVHRGLGWIEGRVVRMAPADTSLKVPHMGWNRVLPSDGSGLPQGEAYFVHSYVFEVASGSDVRATATHGTPFAAIVGRANLTGVQFHPEKSQAYGLGFLKNWLEDGRWH
ncbi:imidazole glycerol phosphate synthase subunit HisH [Polymorphobacter multimanifer]|uniref:Imidazole glycerol phosphate synthase subunit HisH n=1 Tax=Polymorphobacter multimanifer TaxID=1070431 RepID=A0A841L8S7_9SPHN|nr:imidazole glycerol phosphate synthase subunit HisH [Polymorphobacter multimanifer]MBB6227373.1 glutamine amidotransferase [Polymorphobacter multimanifer]GGI89140.1 imidazole glycerol phosphate synthase subunit HisH [Polymorphobacter multimanifer]